MKVFIYRDKKNNKIEVVRTMSEADFLIIHKTKENVLRIIEKQNSNEKEKLKVEMIEDSVLTEILEWFEERR